MSPFVSKHQRFLKIVLAACSFAVMASWWGWKKAAVIFTMLYIHEHGHLWAMRRCGISTKGAWFIPFMGAVAISDTNIPSRQAAFIYAMGPVAGCLSMPLLLLMGWLLTGSMKDAATMTGWALLINTCNLVPFAPFDGGAILRVVVQGIGAPFLAMVLGMVGTALLGWFAYANMDWSSGVLCLLCALGTFTMSSVNKMGGAPLTRGKAWAWLLGYASLVFLSAVCLLATMAIYEYAKHNGHFF